MSITESQISTITHVITQKGNTHYRFIKKNVLTHKTYVQLLSFTIHMQLKGFQPTHTKLLRPLVSPNDLLRYPTVLHEL